jgi:hypothetical protein
MELPKDVQDYFKRTGKTGGKARAKNLSAAKRKAIARKAARARWGKKGKK